MAGNGVAQLGSILERLGHLTKERIEEVLRLQKRDASAGVTSRFGELCVRQGPRRTTCSMLWRSR